MNVSSSKEKSMEVSNIDDKLFEPNSVSSAIDNAHLNENIVVTVYNIRLRLHTGEIFL